MVHTEPVSILPKEFLEHGSFKVRRTSGNVSIMVVNPKGKVHFEMTSGKIYVDMCDDHRSIFKTVEISERFIEENTALDIHGTTLVVGEGEIACKIQAIWEALVGQPDEATVEAAPSESSGEPVDEPEPEAKTEPEAAAAEPETEAKEPEATKDPEPEEPEVAKAPEEPEVAKAPEEPEAAKEPEPEPENVEPAAKPAPDAAEPAKRSRKWW
jgi:outer membrane biosynthesis protein TonB